MWLIKIVNKWLMSIVILVFATNVHSQNNKGVCIDDSFYVPVNATIYINNDLKLESTSSFVLEGRCVFFNSSEIELANYFIGNGIVIFRGTSDATLISNNSELGSLFLEMDGADIYTDGDVTVKNVLKLSSGKIITGFNNEIYVSNSDENAIEYNEDALSVSYIKGNLKRAVDVSPRYYYPIGNNNGYHPFYIRNSSSVGDVQVCFDDNIPGLWETIGKTPSVKLEESGAWIVKSLPGVEMQFIAGLSTLDSYQQPLSDLVNIFYTNNLNFLETDISNESVSVSPYYLEGNFIHSSGIYALAKSTKQIDQFSNTLYVNGNNDSRFKIDLSKFKTISLVVFDSFGREVFNSIDYQNNFDAQYMQSGTYYYFLKGELINGQPYNHNDFIEIIR